MDATRPYHFFFFIGFLTLLVLRFGQVKFTRPFTPQSSSFTLAPPAQAVWGTLTVTYGRADMLTRTAPDYEEASTGAKILIGESVATKEYSAATVWVSDIVTAVLGSKTELVFANLFADNMLLIQKAGQSTYTVAPGKHVSIRALHALIALESGITTITLNGTNLSVATNTGSAAIALVDMDNMTRVWNLGSGQSAAVDDTTREVRLVGKW
ncbi:MAG: hypothetical protein AAB557_01520 [Patescibacteria group bacterium]